ncbi:MAG: TRAP transporter large permease subunit [Proteobacteria bacterium]|nr:TRAP transporter large permease subunit [Pseudomonadota bacterium]
METILILVFILLVLFGVAIGTPLFSIIGGLGLYFFSSINTPTSVIIVEIGRVANLPGIIAIPLFTFSGYLLAESQAPLRLIKLSRAFLSWLPGGLGIVVLVGSAIFTAITGANAVAIIAIGGILLPALIGSGYDERFSLGIVTASGSLGVLFPPSLAVIIYSIFSQTDIVLLFIGGLLPGLLMIALLGMYTVWYARRAKMPSEPLSLKKIFEATKEAKWEIPLPFVVVVGMFSGIITVGEAAAITAAYVIIVECFLTRDVPFNKLTQVIIDSMMMAGALMVIFGLALGLTNFLVFQHIPEKILDFLQQYFTNKYTFLLALNVFLLIVGCMMDLFTAILVVVPLILPIAKSYGIDQVHLGVIFLSNLTIGFLTPPIGLDLFIASMRFNKPVVEIFRATIPFFIILVIALLIITYWPTLSLILIDVMGKRPPLIVI